MLNFFQVAFGLDCSQKMGNIKENKIKEVEIRTLVAMSLKGFVAVVRNPGFQVSVKGKLNTLIYDDAYCIFHSYSICIQLKLPSTEKQFEASGQLVETALRRGSS